MFGLMGMGRQQAAGSGPHIPGERILNTTLDTGANIAAPLGGWTLDGLGEATNTVVGRQLQFELAAPITAGVVSLVSIDVFDNPGVANVLVEAFSVSDSSFFLLLDDATGSMGVLTAPDVVVTGGPYDRVRIRCFGADGTVISGLSVLV